MAAFEIQDNFSLKSQRYALTTTVDADLNLIKFVLFRQSKDIFSAHKTYQPALEIDEIKELATKFHEFYKAEIEKLIQLAKKLRQEDPHETSLELLARGFLKYGLILEAIALLTPKNGKDFNFLQTRFTLGKAYFAARQYDAARKEFDRMLNAEREFADSYFYLGMCDYHLQDCPAAFRAFAKAVEINPLYGEAYFYLTLTLLNNAILDQNRDLVKNLSKRAKTVLHNAVKNIPELKVKAAHTATQFIENEQYQEAYDCLVPLTNIVDKRTKPDIVNYKFHLSVLLDPQSLKPEKVWQEIHRLQGLIPKYPMYPDLHYELGFAFAVLGTSVTATSAHHFERAVVLNPDYKSAVKGLKLIQNDQRGYYTMLHAMMQVH